MCYHLAIICLKAIFWISICKTSLADLQSMQIKTSDVKSSQEQECAKIWKVINKIGNEQNNIYTSGITLQLCVLICKIKNFLKFLSFKEITKFG